MAVTEATVSLTPSRLSELQSHLRETGVDGWLLFDFRGCNPIAGGVLGLPPLTRRYCVYIPADGRPRALTHIIEQGPWRDWIGENLTYLSWESFEAGLQGMLPPGARVALEYSEGDAVPYLDRIPAGILELVARSGVTSVSSGDLVSGFYSRWTEPGLESHRRAARVLKEVAHAAFDEIGAALLDRRSITESDVRRYILNGLHARGLVDGADAVVAVNANAANPHYAPPAEGSSVIRRGDTVLIDLWGKEGPPAVFADQTWMAFVGTDVPGRVQELWVTIRDGRDAGVALIRDRFERGIPIAGYEVDEAVRRLIRERGHGDAFIHRTGHSIDRELHGSGPNIDNLETRDTRRLIPGIGFSIEPGVYYGGELGLRTEIDVYIAKDGPIVTTPNPQNELYLIR